MSTRAKLIAAALLALPALSAEAQQRAPAKPAAPPKPAAVAEPPPVFPCRTQAEICYLGIVVGAKVAILYSNAPEAAAADGPVDVAGADGAKLDLAKDNGRVVMLTGTFDPKAGITKAEIVEVAGPLQSLVVKAQLAGGGEEPAAPPKGGARRR